MEPFALVAAVLTIAAFASYANYRLLKLPTTIGVMAVSLAVSLCLVFVDDLGLDVAATAERLLEAVDFRDTLLNGMLAFLLFAGALHVDFAQLRGQRKIITLLATIGTVATTVVAAVLILGVFRTLGFEVTLGEALLFGALIAPTDPIAVLGILKSAGVPKSLEIKFAGESLFNDGIGVVVFSTILSVVAVGSEGPTGTGDVVLLLLQEVPGSLVLGAAAGYGTFLVMRTVDDYLVEVLLTLALASGLYTLADSLHASGPLAVVVAGLWIGNSGRALAMSHRTRERLDTFWEVVDGVLNVCLFVLIGLELLVVERSWPLLVSGLLAIPMVLGARFLAVGGAVRWLDRSRDFTPHAVKLLTWGGLRGGISVALALSIPTSVPGREPILTVTYVVVVFSILVQGLTIGPLTKRLLARHA